MGQSICSCCKFLFGVEEVRILVVGLKGAGKTTILHRMRLGEIEDIVPTIIGFSVQTLKYKNVNIIAWDVGGEDNFRCMWGQYLPNARGVIFVLDSNDSVHIDQARSELKNLLADHELSNVPLLVYANKQDLPCAMAGAEVAEKLGLYSLDRPWYLQRCSATTSADPNSPDTTSWGVMFGFEWLADRIQERTK